MTEDRAELPRLLAQALPGGVADWHEALLAWLLAAPIHDQSGSSARTERLRALLDALDGHPQRDLLRERVTAAWNAPSAARLLAEAGIAAYPSILREAMHRISRSLLPRVPTDGDLRELLAHLDLTHPDADWILSLPADVVRQGAGLLPAQAVLHAAAQLIATRAAGHGVARDFLDVYPDREVTTSPFVWLPDAVVAGGAAASDALAACRADLRDIDQRLATRGVSTDVVYRLEVLESLLERLETILRVAANPAERGQRFVADIVRGAASQESLGSVARTASKRLARRVVEHTGEAGEHYRVRTRTEWRVHFNLAAAAGFLTTFTALGKHAIAALPFAPFVSGIALWGNYSTSFCIMQVRHWLLASKQPAMTAAALAASLEHGTDNAAEIELIAGITRSQTVVTLANAVSTILLAVFLDFGFHAVTGRWILGLESAQHGMASIQPVTSLTVVYAVTTGISLWLSSLAAGWAANWSAFNRLPDALRRDPRIVSAVGSKRARAMGDFVQHHFGGIAGYVVLGMLLGFVPVLCSRFLGIHLEVRHITLQAASTALTILPLQDAGLLGWQLAVGALLGVILTGLLNFSVSFALALRTAIRARDLDARERSVLWRDLWKAFVADPGRFLWKPQR